MSETLAVPLRDLLSQTKAEGRSPFGLDEVAASDLDERLDFASAHYSLICAGKCQRWLDDQRVRLDTVLSLGTPRNLDERVRVVVAMAQSRAVKAELDRRRHFCDAVRQRMIDSPPYTRIVGALAALRERIRQGSAPEATEFVREAAERIVWHSENTEAGIDRVASVLEDVVELQSPTRDFDADTVWVQWGVAIDLLTGGRGFGLVVSPEGIQIDPVTRAEAQRAEGLFYAYTRADPRLPRGSTDLPGWPLDLPGDQLAALLRRASAALLNWADAGLPESDLWLFSAPCRAEEIGRPEAHAQIVPEREARDRAASKGGILYPMLYKVDVNTWQRVGSRVWQEGVPTPEPTKLGVTLFGAPGDPGVAWGAAAHPHGLLCAVALDPSRILRIDPSTPDPAVERIFREVTTRATDMATAPGAPPYAAIERDLFLRAGIQAIARYDHANRMTRTPQTLILLDNSPNVLMIIRESVPSFLTAEPPPILPIKPPSKGHQQSRS